MAQTIAEINDIPAALPVSESDERREKLLREAAQERTSPNENLLNEAEEEEPENLEQIAKPSKKKLLLAFIGFIFGFLLLVLLLCWFFGIGIFAVSKVQPVDRTAKPNFSSPATPVTEDEKLKMALNLVAERNPNGNSESAVNPLVSETVDHNSNSSVNVPLTKTGDLNAPVVVPDVLSQANQNQVNIPTSSPINKLGSQNSVVSTENQSGLRVKNSNRTETQSKPPTETAPLGRSLFFGVELKEKREVKQVAALDKQVIFTNQNAKSMTISPTGIPFGILLPVRLLGAVYTLRASGGLVRMELTRSISGKNYSYPAGTILVGSLRGSEYKRAFISVVGLIDPNTGGLVKFEGEVMGTDGASGIEGRLRQVKGIWSRVFGGLREAGSVALGAIGNRHSGGTVIISDASSKASGALTDELSGLIGSKRNKDEFVEVSAGTTGFVLVTDLPDEISDRERLSQNSKTATGLSETELADLFSKGNREKISAALARMTPQFRRLAEKVLAMEDK